MERTATIQTLLKSKRGLEDVAEVLLNGDYLTVDDEDDLIFACQDVLFHAVRTIDLGTAADAENHRNTYRYMPRAVLHVPVESVWQRIIDKSTSDTSFSVHVRFSRASFNRLLMSADLDLLAWWDGYTDRTRQHRARGRPHALDGRAHMGLALTYMATRADLRMLGSMFGSTNPGRDLGYSLQMLHDTLRNIPLSACRLKGREQLILSADAVESVYGRCPIPWLRPCAAGDCFVSYMFNPGEAIDQNSFYNGKNGQVAVNNLTLVDFTGHTFYFRGNRRGKRHDSQLFVSSGCEQYLRENLPPGYFVIFDDAFGHAGIYDICWCNGRFDPQGPVHPDRLKEFYYYCLKIRKTPEWANHTYYQLWPRLLQLLPAEDHVHRGLLLSIGVRLTNLITRWEDNHSQIKSVFREGLLRSPLAGLFDR